VFYGNTAVNPERFMGLAPRYNTVATATAQSANNVIDAGGVGAVNTSIWVVVWGPNTDPRPLPEGPDLGPAAPRPGRVDALDVNNNPYQGYRTHFKWDMGSPCATGATPFASRTSTSANLRAGRGEPHQRLHPRRASPADHPGGISTEQTSDAPDKGAMSMGRTAIYCNRTIRTYLDIQALNKANVLLKFEEWDGKPVTTFRGIPIRTCDQILNTEARVV
jgi:hypothetical protein